jgi:hypothetical protein
MLTMKSSITDCLAKLRPLAISDGEAAALSAPPAHRDYLPGEIHRDAFRRVNQARHRHLAFLAARKDGFNQTTNARGATHCHEPSR